MYLPYIRGLQYYRIMKESAIDLIKREKWEIVTRKVEVAGGIQEEVKRVLVYGKEYPLKHPLLIHLNLYKNEQNPEVKYKHMKAAHDYLWPKEVEAWHYWTEERFRTHCEHWNYIAWASGANQAKSYDAAKMALLYWWADPKNRGVIIASTTLESATARVWGYLTQRINDREIKLPLRYAGGKPPKVLFPKNADEEDAEETICGIFAVAAKQGGDSEAINTWIGRHPPGGLLLVLDEAPDLNPAISKAFINLDASGAQFQCIGIGNSNSWFDLHGMLSYPKDGIDSVDPNIHTRWETTQKNGICLYFNPRNSPAIHEIDPKKKKILSKFLITEDRIKEKEEHYGKDSEDFYRMVLGFWRKAASDKTIVSIPFLDAHKVKEKAEWLGYEPLTMVAGLDPAFSSGGDSCILRLAVLGQAVDGSIILDFKDKALLFVLKINAKIATAIEIQIAEQTKAILEQFGVPIKTLCVDANGQGRALGGTIQLQCKSLVGPTKIYSVKSGDTNTKSFDVKIMEAYELWSGLRTFMENDQIRGLDNTAMLQLTNRLIITVDAKGKPCKPRLENKVEFKRRMGGIMPKLAHSPDEADAAALCLQSAIIHYGFRKGQKRDIVLPSVSFENQKLAAFKAELQKKKEQAAEFAVSSGFGHAVTDFKGIAFKPN